MMKGIFNRVTTEITSSGRAVNAPAPRPPAGLSEPPRRSPVLPGMLVAGVVVVALAVWAGVARRHAKDKASAGEALRTAVLKRGDFVRVLRLNGSVQAVQATTVAAPRLAGQQIGRLVITRLTPPGTKVKKGDLLVEFDRQDQIKTAMDQQATYKDLLDQIEKKKADQASARAKDDTELKQAEDALKTAQLEMRKNEIASRIDAEVNKENLEEAQAKLKQLRATYDLKRRAAEADLKILEIQRDRADAAMLYARKNAERMSIHAPMEGLVVLNNIWKGDQMGEVQEGDQVWPGRPFMQVVNPQAMEVRVPVNQADVTYLRLEMPARVRLDAYPDLVFPALLSQLAAVGVASSMSQKVHTFAATFSIRGTDPKLMPDLSAAVDVELERLPNALVAPRDALWTENGQTYIRVKSGFGFEKRAVKTGAMSDAEVAIESGVDAGAVVLRGGAGRPTPAAAGSGRQAAGTS